MPTLNSWPAITDEAGVERLIGAIQQTIAANSPVNAPYSGETPVNAPDLANVLLMLLATVLEGAPECATPAGLRKMAEGAGRELHQLMKETRQLKIMPGSRT